MWNFVELVVAGSGAVNGLCGDSVRCCKTATTIIVPSRPVVISTCMIRGRRGQKTC